MDLFHNKLPLWQMSQPLRVRCWFRTSAEEEEKKEFWRQSNREFLAKKQEEIMKNAVPKKIEKRTCFQCKIAGHVAKNCPKTFKPKQEVSGKLKEKVVVNTELSTRKFTGFENSIFEKGDCSKNVLKRKENVMNQKWVVKRSGNSSGDESDSTKSEEPRDEKKVEKPDPTMNDENFPPLRVENFMKKVGRVEISNQIYSDKKKFDVEKAFNGNVKRMFGKMVNGQAKSVKDFYASKQHVHKSVERKDEEEDVVTPKEGQAWVDIFFKE
ncbi:putative transcription factor interactor and regulator CCHC(Zn) family [Helianthus debilis subsp. tardiflorus]